MNNDSFDPLDKQLGDWAASRHPDDQHARELANRILSAALLQERSDRDRSSSKDTSWNTKLVLGAGGLLAVAALIGFMVLSSRVIESSEYPMTATLDASIVSAKQQLLAESNALFDHQLAWIADGQRKVMFEMRDSGSDDNGEFTLVRVVVARRDSSQAPWSTVWQTDVISRDEEFVEVTRDRGEHASIILWTHQISDGEVVVEMDLKLDQWAGDQSSTTSVVRVGQPTRVRHSNVNGVEYGVFQSVVPLPELPLLPSPI